MLVMHNAMLDNPIADSTTQLYLWAYQRAFAAAGTPNSEDIGRLRAVANAMPPATDAAVFEFNGWLHEDYRRLTAEIIRKVTKRSPIGRSKK